MKKNYLFIIALLITTLSFGQNVGDIIITEIMQNPNAVSDDDGEYFEMYNTTDADIDINGWTIRDNGTNLDTIDHSVIVSANGFVVLGKNADMATNGGISIDYEYNETIFLANGSDALILKKVDGTTIDEVVWDNGATFPDPSGKSMNLSPNSFNSVDNNQGANWCEATSAIGTQFGTPGATNDDCPLACALILGETTTVCETTTENTDTYTATFAFSGGGTETYSITVNTGSVSGDDPTSMESGIITITGVAEGTNLTIEITSESCDLSESINSPLCDPFMVVCANEGDIIFTEVMQNPMAVADNMGEWFEIHNTTATAIDLHGFDIIDDNHPLAEEGFTISETLMIPAGGYLVFANNGDTETNGGVTADWVYDPSLTLGNGTDGITIQCEGNIIDIVVWDGGTNFPDPNGKSMNLNANNLNSTDNDDGANWCEAISQFATDFGTPGMANDVCPSPCTLELGATTATCDATTENTDTYTATLAFSGGGTQTYTISTDSGTITGDNPTDMESGIITVSDVVEGTNLTITISSESCNLAENINSPVCDPFTPTCVNEGDLIITEVMQNPMAVADNMGEWFEIHNTTATAIDLHGFDIVDDNHPLAEEGFTISETLMIPAGGYLVFANNADSETNGGVNPDWVYDPSLTLGNGTDGITVQCGGNIIDIVIWDNGATFPDPNGKSMNLNADNLNSTDNDDGANWCEAISQFATDFGTPGTANDICPPACTLELGETTAECETITVDTDTYTATLAFTGGQNAQTFTITSNTGTVAGDNPTDMATGTITVTGAEEGVNVSITISSESCNLSATINSPICDPFTPSCANVGDLIFTEVMQNPMAVSDDMGEWFEIHNTTAADIDLHGYDIIDDNHTLAEEGFTISETLIIPANGYLVFANNADMNTNGGINPDWVYDPSLTLGNGTDGISIQCEGNLIDIIIWDNGATFPDPNGKSMNLNITNLNSVANDDGINWCEAISQFATDFGTPAAANDECGAPCLLDLGAASVECDAITAGVDNYTATLDFSGGGTETYAITVNAGTVTGDNPSSTADGTITVTGIAEGTDVTIEVTGGTCILSRTISSAVCVPATCAAPGSIILTEIMQNPSAVSDGMGEWFEVFNTTSETIDMQGWEIVDDNMAGEGFTIATSLIIPAGGYLVFANNGDAATNGGLTPDYVYDPSLTLGNGTDGLQIKCSGALIDIVIWDDGATFPDPNGASMSLFLDHLNAADNNIGAFWGTATTTYGEGNLGTPGAENDFTIAITDLDIEGLQVYPNPIFDQSVYISTTNTDIKTIELYTILGQKVYTTSFDGQSKRLNFGNLTAGIYCLKIKAGDKTAIVNLIVQ